MLAIIARTRGPGPRLDIGPVVPGNKMRYLIYKITNQINGRYYIGRHRTNNIDDSYMGSGIAISNAIKKYGISNFSKEIIAESWDETNLWELEKIIVNEEIVKDPKSYNMTYGGKHYLHGLKTYDSVAFIKHQRMAGIKGGPSSYNKRTDKEKKEWHSKGGKSSAQIQKMSKTHPFYNGVAASLGGKALIGMVELWNPNPMATNKNQKEYQSGDCKRVYPNTKKFKELVINGWSPIDEHKRKIKVW